jgi:addiction module RelE/StbE family toxin|nr:type II toxin-antitoxin system YafQ family toxin [Dolichospermum sp. UHCC 0315A]
MMLEVVWSSGFKRSFRKITKKTPQLKNQIVNVLRLLSDDPFTPSLKSHKLGGNLAGLWSCSVAYDCRIIFNFSEDEELLEMVILLIDIGSHDEVY